MSLEPAIIVNHNIKFNLVPEFAEQLSLKTGRPFIMPEKNGDGNNDFEEVPPDFKGWVVYCQPNNMDLDKGGLIEFRLIGRREFSFYLGIDSLEISRTFYFGQWNTFVDLAKKIAGTKGPDPTFEENMFNKFRMDIYDYFHTLGTSEMLIFCNDEQPYLFDNLGERDFTYEKLLKWCRKKLLLTEYEDLKQLPLNFDEADDNFSNFCIHDTFKGIK
jgi:hypothetical protein